jgi:hypothetical protein
MSFKVTKLTVGKGKTLADEKAGEWNREYFEIEAVIEDEHQLELAKSSIEALLDMWLRGESITEPEPEKPSWDPNRIKWVDAQGASGSYQRYPPEGERAEATEDYKNMLADLKAHNGKLSRKEADGTWFYWVFQDAATVGRKKRGGKSESAAQTQPQEPQLDKIKAAFPQDLQSLLTFEVQGEMCVIKARQYLGTENFAKIASVVRGLGGEYVSQGKDSHFKVPLSK